MKRYNVTFTTNKGKTDNVQFDADNMQEVCHLVDLMRSELDIDEIDSITTAKYDIGEVLEMTFDMCEDYYDDIHKSTLTWILNGGNLPFGSDVIKWCAEMCGIDVNDICGSLTETDVYRIVYNYLRINAFEITYVEELGKLIAFWSIEDGDEMEEEFVAFVYGCDLEDRKLLDEKIEEFLEKKMLEIKNG